MRVFIARLQFASRDEFTNWLKDNGRSSSGVWLLFGKSGGPKTVKVSEALEKALCFGLIDGQMQNINNKTYLKYFSLRTKNSKWSDKNKLLVEKLKKQGLIADYGREKITEAKKNGQGDAPKPQSVTDEQIAVLVNALKEHETAYTNFFWPCPNLLRKHIQGRISTQKTDATRNKRLLWIIERLNENLKPM